jgi:hypothetical protein
MPEINEEVVADIYKEYKDARHDRQRTETLVGGVKMIFSRLPMYLNDPERYKEKCDIAVNELTTLLNRFYYNDTLFIDRLIYEARAYIIEIGEK